MPTVSQTVTYLEKKVRTSIGVAKYAAEHLSGAVQKSLQNRREAGETGELDPVLIGGTLTDTFELLDNQMNAPSGRKALRTLECGTLPPQVSFMKQFMP